MDSLVNNSKYNLLYSIEAELTVLSCLLKDKNIFEEAERILQTEDFYKKSHQYIFESMKRCHAKGYTVDPISVYEDIKEKKLDKQIGDIDGLTMIYEYADNSLNVLSCINIIKEKSIRRRLYHIGTEICSNAIYSVSSMPDAINSAEEQIMSLSVSNHSSSNEHISTMADLVAERRRKDANKESDSIPTYYKNIDGLLNGLGKSDLLLLAARPSVGKTAFALNLAVNMAQEKKRVLIFSLEMTNIKIFERLMAIYSGVSFQVLNADNKTRDDIAAIDFIHESIINLPIEINDSSELTALDIRSIARKVKKNHGNLDCIIIDYIQLIKGTSARSVDNRNQEISEISRSLKLMAKELNIPVIALSQLNRASESRNNHRPMLGDLRESGALEQDADVVMFLYRDDYYQTEKKVKNPDLTELIVSKHRNGPVGTLYFNFKKETGRFQELNSDVKEV